MTMNSATLDKWRNYFRSANSDIFDIIEHAIMVAASDCPKDFRVRRDRIAERLFACKLTRCSACDGMELAVPIDDEDDEGCKSGFAREFEAGGGKESKVNSSGDDHMNQVSNYSFVEAEALTDEIEEECQIVGEVLRIKEILDNFKYESDSMLFDSLRKLQLMALSVETLKATEIGKAVNGLRKHGSNQIRHLVRALIEGWKVMVDEWVNATAPIAVVGTEGTPESVNPSTLDEEEGLPSPPMDEGAFFTQTTSMELSQFFDGMDDDGNPQNSREFQKKQNGRKPSFERKQQEVAPKQQQQKNEEDMMKKKQAATPMKQNKAESGPGRPTKPSKTIPRKRDFKLNSCSDEAVERVKVEATKRKLQERYQEAENAKRQRAIQVMELQDIPKQLKLKGSVGHKNQQHFKAAATAGNNSRRQWGPNGRRR